YLDNTFSLKRASFGNPDICSKFYEVNLRKRGVTELRYSLIINYLIAKTI
ncbi:MAG: hypothetical protein ACI921_001767, partial [Polaribacter sp.]